MNGPFTRAGQRTVQRWARHAATSTGQAVRVDEAAHAYVDLSRLVQLPWHPVLRWHLAAYLLPGVAVYRTLVATQVPQPEARQAVARALAADNEPRRLRLRRLGQHRWFYGLFAVAVRALSSLLFPRPGWRIRWGEVSRARIAFDIDRCYYLDVLTRLGIPELTPAYCHLDDVLYTDISPQVAWQRDHTLAAGCDRCTFRYHRRPPGAGGDVDADRDDAALPTADASQGPADARSGRVVFLAHCLLNQNTRYPGGAVCPGVVEGALTPYLTDGTGIVQLPCPEQRTWGGVPKRHLQRLTTHPAAARTGQRLLRPARTYLRWRYRRLARGVVHDIADYITSGFDVAGIVGVAGSPSCGVTTTLDLAASLQAIASCPHRSVTATWLDTQVVGPSIRPGRGLFTAALRTELARQDLDVPVTQYALRSRDAS